MCFAEKLMAARKHSVSKDALAEARKKEEERKQEALVEKILHQEVKMDSMIDDAVRKLRNIREQERLAKEQLEKLGRMQAYMNEKLTAGDIVGLCPLLYQTVKLLGMATEVYVNTCEEYGISREDAEANKEIPESWTPTA